MEDHSLSELGERGNIQTNKIIISIKLSLDCDAELFKFES